MSIDPVGPSGWTAMNWFGLFLQILFFVGVIFGFYLLSRSASHDRPG